MNTVNLTQVERSLHNYLESDSEDEEKYSQWIKRHENFRSVSQNASAASSYEDNLDNLDHLENFYPNGCQRPFLINHLSDLSTRTAVSAIQEFVETSIVLRKDQSNQLGINITGGSDTYLESVCVAEVHRNGAAYKDGRLRKGDVILAVNEISFRGICWKDAIKIIKECESPLRLLVLRENPQKLFTTPHDATKFITIQLKKGSIKDKLGISFIQRINGRGVFITYVQPGGIASRQGHKIMQGDQILEINGQSVRESNQKDVAALINSLDGEIVLLLGRNQSHSNLIQEWIRKKSQIHWKNRTSTWSAYAGNKEKISNQRPSLPVSNEQSYFAGIPSPDKDNKEPFHIPLTATCCESNLVEGDENNKRMSRSSSSGHRLSIVVEDSKAFNSQDSDQDGETQSCKGFPLVPSIHITEF